jgi:D-serine deaminase-like pyridoxal phosphate-dependent protein
LRCEFFQPAANVIGQPFGRRAVGADDAGGEEPGPKAVGLALECLTPHCDPTVNLYDVYHVVHGDTLVDIWPIDARGAI